MHAHKFSKEIIENTIFKILCKLESIIPKHLTFHKKSLLIQLPVYKDKKNIIENESIKRYEITMKNNYHSIPHQKKKEKGGEDAYIVLEYFYFINKLVIF